MNLNQFTEAVKQKGIQLSEEQMQEFMIFYELLINWNEKMNLTGITKLEDVLEKHFYDCLTPVDKIDFNGKILIDIGAGAGFPCIPLKIAIPSLTIIVVDSLGKRMTFLNEVIAKLKLKNIKTVVARGEDYARTHFEQADIVTARAVARLNMLHEICLPLVKVGGYFVAYKGMDGQQEIKECQNAFSLLGGVLEMVDEFNLISDNAKRTNIFVKKISKTPSIYPRDFAKIKKAPLR